MLFARKIFVRIENGEISSYPMKGTINADQPDAVAIIMNDVKDSRNINRWCSSSATT